VPPGSSCTRRSRPSGRIRLLGCLGCRAATFGPPPIFGELCSLLRPQGQPTSESFVSFLRAGADGKNQRRRRDWRRRACRKGSPLRDTVTAIAWAVWESATAASAIPSSLAARRHLFAGTSVSPLPGSAFGTPCRLPHVPSTRCAVRSQQKGHASTLAKTSAVRRRLSSRIHDGFDAHQSRRTRIRSERLIQVPMRASDLQLRSALLSSP